jgi:uncharacterized repeat protein (TIGR01451 family)
VTATVGISAEVETRGATVQVLSNPSIALDKSVSTPSAKVGEPVTYTFEVRNVGTVTLHDIVLADDRLGAIALVTDTLVPGAATTANAVHVIQAGDLPGPLTNTATVTGTGPTGLVRTAQDSAAVAISYRPRIEVQVTGTPATGLPGTTITYTYQAVNVGDVQLDSVTLTDSRLGAVTLSGATLAPGASTSGTLRYVIAAGDLPGPLTNTATATASSPTGGAVQGTASATTGVVNPNAPNAPGNLFMPIIGRN